MLLGVIPYMFETKIYKLNSCHSMNVSEHVLNAFSEFFLGSKLLDR